MATDNVTYWPIYGRRDVKPNRFKLLIPGKPPLYVLGGSGNGRGGCTITEVEAAVKELVELLNEPKESI